MIVYFIIIFQHVVSTFTVKTKPNIEGTARFVEAVHFSDGGAGLTRSLVAATKLYGTSFTSGLIAITLDGWIVKERIRFKIKSLL